jgi:hypothetical protein
VEHDESRNRHTIFIPKITEIHPEADGILILTNSCGVAMRKDTTVSKGELL